MDCDWTTWHKTLDKSYFNSKIIWITGCSSGIGKALAEHLASLQVGTKLVISARRESKLQQLKQELTDKYSDAEIMVLPMDLSETNVAYYQEKYNSVLQHFGVNCIDILINNAGVSMRSTFLDFDIKDSIDMLQINLVSPIILTKLVLTDMHRFYDDERHRFGHIVSIGSMISRLQAGCRSVYAASKGGLLAFGNSLNEELRYYPNIKLTEILPGLVQTDVDVASKGKFGGDHKQRDASIQGGMTAERAAERIAVAISNGLRESWPAIEGPLLPITYMSYYLPALYEKYARPAITQRLLKAAGALDGIRKPEKASS
eukprot:CAMPEP_0197042090 /NCGR_PEP_ID=MMETSP1384-20130603/18531_1 /TAXON_ID=29189 /ORGANISM="Ammonia sp." /LENGTH=315 /DNA_ID=CAMNT_0042473129 /DNA_START=42 /DNA_END=989 /DNA_ORIENTATION=+